MNILVFGPSDEASELVDLIDSHHQFIFRKKSYTASSDYDEFLQSLKSKQDIVFILANGAK